jgi:hypothetical protein
MRSFKLQDNTITYPENTYGRIMELGDDVRVALELNNVSHVIPFKTHTGVELLCLVTDKNRRVVRK